ncbi:VanZ family protein [Knoellia sp. CPCC 206450]|uniref:VanZ family protein n=1 Tax=Knoellia tibetensis TaxID=3404798 RepID=UPI003B42B5F7
MLPAAVAMVVQLAVVYAPSAGGAPAVPHLDKLVHAAVFALPVLFGLLARLPLVPVVAVMALHAPVSEVIQGTLLPQRSGDPWDAVADLVGVALGVVVATAVLRRSRGAADREGRSRASWSA